MDVYIFACFFICLIPCFCLFDFRMEGVLCFCFVFVLWFFSLFFGYNTVVNTTCYKHWRVAPGDGDAGECSMLRAEVGLISGLIISVT